MCCTCCIGWGKVSGFLSFLLGWCTCVSISPIQISVGDTLTILNGEQLNDLTPNERMYNDTCTLHVLNVGVQSTGGG